MIRNKEIDRLRVSGGLFDVEPCEMDLNIGRKGIRTNLGAARLGTIAGEPFQIVAVQLDCQGQKCYRIVHESDKAQFGCVLEPCDDFRFLDKDE